MKRLKIEFKNKLLFNSKRLMNCKNEETIYKILPVKNQYMRIWYGDIAICETDFPCEYSKAILYTGKKEWILLNSPTKYRIKIEGCLKNVWIGKVIFRDEAIKLTNAIIPSLTEIGNIEEVYMIYARCKASMHLLDPHMRDYVNNFPFEKNDIVSIKAVAGSGKTTTLLKLAQENSDKKILYLAFNKALANEVRLKRNKIAKNLQPYTFDAFIRQCFINKFPNKGFPIKFLNTFTFGEEYPWFQKKPARMKKTFISKFNTFCKNIKYNEMYEFMNELYPTASPFTKRQLIKMWHHTKQNKLMTFDGLRKLALVQHWFKDYLDTNYDMIFIDEAQDFDPVMLEILLKDSTIPKVFVGDPRQAIYEWRGAINAFEKLPEHTNTVEFYTTWRIGEPACDKIRCKFKDCWMIAGNKNETLLHHDKEPDDKYDYLFRSWRYLLQIAATKQNVWVNDYYKKIEFIKRLHKKLQKYPLSEEEKAEFEDDLPNFLLSLSSYELEKLIADIEKNSVPKKCAMCCMYTIHSYKGMENDNIRVFNDIDHEEEENIYYVALTRGIKNIYLDSPPEDENKKQSTMMPVNFRRTSSKKKRCLKKGSASIDSANWFFSE
jgi:superfamily I DNA/RNA helicase